MSSPLPDLALQQLSTRRIFFGHQSVGSNIISGLAELRRLRPAFTLPIVEAASLAGVTGPALVHRAVGRNHDPASKSRDFAEALDAGDAAGAIALHKLCYVDLDDDGVRPEALFADYERAMALVRTRHPTVTLVHVTMPVTRVERAGLGRRVLKRMLGRPESYEYVRNIRRARFNALMRHTFAGREPLFDLARAEATDPAGVRHGYEVAGQWVESLAPAYTRDGAHLDQLGSLRVAEALLITLAAL